MKRRSFLIGAPALVLGSGMFRPAWSLPLIKPRLPVTLWFDGTRSARIELDFT